MELVNWMAVGGVGLGGLGTALVLWSLVRIADRADRRVMIPRDEFDASMAEFGYVQDARNRGQM